MKILTFISFSICLLAFSCKSGPHKGNAEVEKLHEEVMVYHDEAMPKLTVIQKLGKKLPQLIETDGYDKWPADRKKKLNSIMTNLGDAEKGMWSWMYAYKTPAEITADVEPIQYLESELKSVKVMRDKIFNSIEDANKFMKQYGIE